MARPLFASLIAACLAGAACGSSTTPTTPTTPTNTVNYFVGVLNPGESAFYSFRVAAAGTTEITFISMVPFEAAAPALAIPMAVGIGTPAGTGCRTSSTVTTVPALAPQITSATSATTYCVNIEDAGQLTAPAQFVITISHP